MPAACRTLGAMEMLSTEGRSRFSIDSTHDCHWRTSSLSYAVQPAKIPNEISPQSGDRFHALPKSQLIITQPKGRFRICFERSDFACAGCAFQATSPNSTASFFRSWPFFGLLAVVPVKKGILSSDHNTILRETVNSKVISARIHVNYAALISIVMTSPRLQNARRFSLEKHNLQRRPSMDLFQSASSLATGEAK